MLKKVNLVYGGTENLSDINRRISLKSNIYMWLDQLDISASSMQERIKIYRNQEYLFQINSDMIDCTQCCKAETAGEEENKQQFKDSWFEGEQHTTVTVTLNQEI